MKTMKTINKIKKVICTAVLSALLFSLLTAVLAVSVFAEGGSSDYYIALSTQNYAIKNSNKLTKSEDGFYYLDKISLSSDVKFYITDGGSVRYYAASGKEMTVDESKACDYVIKFSPSVSFDTEENGYAATGCHITYAFHTPAQYTLKTKDGEGERDLPMEYNPYFSDYELYYKSSVYFEAGSEVKYGTESHTVSDSGNYRILFTPSVERDGKVYAFNSDGEYGSGEEFIYNIYIEDAHSYYAVFESGITSVTGGLVPTDINGSSGYPLIRYEKNTSGEEYRLSDFFVGSRDTTVKYKIYEKEPTGNFRLIDTDNDDDTDIGKLKISDAGWYELSFTVSGDSYSVSAQWSERELGKYYILGDFNGYGFGAEGGVDIDEKFAFSPVEEDDDNYNEDYEQFILYFTLTEKDVEEGSVDFYISDGENKYKNGTEYISLNAAGKYKILFSEEHIYSQGRHYRYVLTDSTWSGTEIEISSVDEFLAFARMCSESADYSMNLSVYLMCDLDFSSYSFIPVENFSGKFYGGYHTLKNITLESDDTAAFVTVTRYGSIERLNVENFTINNKSGEYVGFIGRNYGAVRKVSVGGRVIGDNYVGAVVAYNGISRVDDNSATIDSNNVVQRGVCDGCVSSAEVLGKSNVGGVVGFNSGEILSSTNSGTVAPYVETRSALTNIGGIAGFSAGKLADCVNLGNVGQTSYGTYVGGVIGFGTGENYFCVNRGDVIGSKYVGGVVGGYGNVTEDESDRYESFGGLDYAAIINSYFSGEDSEEGVLMGDKHSQEYLQNYGNVSADGYVGGVLGNSDYTSLVIRNSLSLGNISSRSGGYVGGILGNGDITVSSCFSSGTVKADGASSDYAGGIAGNVGTVEYCMSTATIIGGDFIGGIAGSVKKHIASSYTNCTVISDSEHANAGLIAGFAESYNPSLHSFGDAFKYNYYIGTLGGVGRTEYAGEFEYAAASLTSDKLLSEGNLSMYLHEFFDHEHWQGGEKNSYPVLTYMFECSDIADIDDEEELFARHKDNLCGAMYSTAKIYYTVTFMEWNKDNGDLYDDDGNLQYTNFEVISSLTVEKGASLADSVSLKYASFSDGVWIYEGGGKVYSVTISSPECVESNLVVYAVYTDMISTLSTHDAEVLIEGLFDARTELQVVRTGEYITLVLKLDGEPINITSPVTVKYRKPSGKTSYEVFKVTEGGELSPVDAYEYGDYICFTADGVLGTYYKIAKTESKTLTLLETVLIAATSVLAVGVIAAISIPAIVKRRRTAGTAPTEESKD